MDISTEIPKLTFSSYKNRKTAAIGSTILPPSGMKPKWHLDGPAEVRAAPAAPAKDKAAQMERGLEAANVSGSLTVISFYVKGSGDS